MCSKLGMDLKRTMLLRLARRDPKLHPDDPAKREAIYNKYRVRAGPVALPLLPAIPALVLQRCLLLIPYAVLRCKRAHSSPFRVIGMAAEDLNISASCFSSPRGLL